MLFIIEIDALHIWSLKLKSLDVLKIAYKFNVNSLAICHAIISSNQVIVILGY